jgi:uncharacterized protein
MDTLLIIIGIACLIGGLVGSVLPLPGPPLSFMGMLLIHYSDPFQFSRTVLYSFGFVTIVVSLLDYYVPIWGIKKLGGTNYGIWGSTIGVSVGFFVIPAIGVFFGAFLGALIGELIGKMPVEQALKAAFGSFLGFLSGIFMKLMLCLTMIVFVIRAFLLLFYTN